ncbi:MAG: M13 family metallopeptidase [Bacilli bacterium]|nr:M13 family metallopeptidase [Bacilli bacterium]
MIKRKMFLIGIVFILGFFFFFIEREEDNLKDNYYLSVNKDILEDNKLEDDEYNWSYFSDAQDKVDEDIDDVLDNILNNNIDKLTIDERRAIEAVYNKAINIDWRNKEGIKVLEPYLDKVWKVSTVEELVNIIVIIEEELGVDLLTNVKIVQDYQDNSKNIVYFYPVTLAFGASGDYIIDEDYMSYKAYLRRACVQLWKAYGYEGKDARAVVERVFAFYEEVRSHSKLASDLDEIADYYQVVALDDIQGILSNAGREYLSRKGINNRDSYSLVDSGQYKYLNDSLKIENLNVWKEVIVTEVLASYASYASSEYIEVVNNLNEGLLGKVEDNTLEEDAQDIVINLFSSEIDKVYEDIYLKDEQIEEIEKMFLEIKDVFRERLRNNNWLSDKAKEKAVLKLDKMKVVVGIGDEGGYEVAKDLRLDNSSLIEDVIEVQKQVKRTDLARLDSGDKIGLVQQTQVNAYYQPLDNSIIIPVAFFELIDDKANYYEKLGILGMILAHEVTHAFDGNGSKFDENGNMIDWWSEDDKVEFEKLKEDVIDYYSKLEVIDGKYIDGEKTVNENIADLGALECIVDIADNKGANNEEFRSMFSSFASIWASQESEEYKKLLLLQDVHAPNEFRVNAVLSSIEEFYSVYNIYLWHDMWISKENRIEVW